MITKARAVIAPWRSYIQFLVTSVDDHGKIGYGQPITFDTEQDERVETMPTFNLYEEEAQILMDDLWNCGFRPTEGTGSAGSLAATERHLKDLQTMVFDHFLKGLRYE